MRYLINLVEARMPYPTPQGKDAASLRHHIIDLLRYHGAKYGEPRLHGAIGEVISKPAFKVAQRMEQEGIIKIEVEDQQGHVTRGGPRVGTPYGNEMIHWQNVTITPGPNFPDMAPPNELNEMRRRRFSWTTKSRLARVFETEEEANAYIADILKNTACSTLSTREGWVIFDPTGKRMLSDYSIISAGSAPHPTG